MNRELRTLVPAALCAMLLALAPGPAQANDADRAVNGMLGPMTGQQTYEQICAGCHMPGGKGAVGAGTYPAFVGNPAVASSNYMAVTILNGRRNMPAFAKPVDGGGWFVPTWLTEQQIADVINYIRGNFGNKYRDKISAEQVRALRPPPAPAQKK